MQRADTRNPVFVCGGVLCAYKVDWFMRPVEFSNDGGDLIGGGLVTGCWWLPPRLDGSVRETREGNAALHHSLRGRENVESPCNTWGPLLQLQEIK